MKSRLVFLAPALAATLLAACTSTAPTQQPTSPTPSATTPYASPWPSDGKTEVPPTTFTVVSAGDILPHTSVYEAAKKPDGTYDFVPKMAESRPFVEGADLALCSLEIPIAPKGTKPSGYPMFGAPTELIGDLKTLGWDGCTIATNHTGDRGWDGLKTTLDLFDQHQLGATGAGRSEAERLSPAYYRLTKDGRTVTIGHVSGTYGLNGMPDPGKAQGFQAVNMLEDMLEAAKSAKAAGADIVIVSPHWGIEYQMQPNDEQVTLARALAESGAVDAIIGTHPHVPQKIESLPGPGGAKVPVVYSTGNFYSGQDENCCTRETATGVMVQLAIEADDTAATVKAMTYTPVTMDLAAGRTQYLLAPLHQGKRPEGLTLEASRITKRWEALLAVMGSELMSTTAPTGKASVELITEPAR
ncbi:CapA family protein [Bowdeniella massiliensis]|uniref:CapA family protein n=1 Tax=Bowdeniella massiliensis TaxID=2932264 RepID=UPI0020298910